MLEFLANQFVSTVSLSDEIVTEPFPFVSDLNEEIVTFSSKVFANDLMNWLVF